jgi:hypothetical protein
MRSKTTLPSLLGAIALFASAGCGPAEGVQVQELPELERPSPQARAGLAEVEGAWNHAGWEVAYLQVGEVLEAERAPRAVVFQVQRLDSLSGFLLRTEGSRRFVGEIRRDGIVSMLVAEAEQGSGVVAGAVEGDTLWLELSTLAAVPIPPGARAAYVRAPAGQIWVRLPSGALLRDTVVAPPPGDTLPPAPAPLPGPDAPPADVAEPRQPVVPPAQPQQPAPQQPAPAPDPDVAPEPGPPSPEVEPAGEGFDDG